MKSVLSILKSYIPVVLHTKIIDKVSDMSGGMSGDMSEDMSGDLSGDMSGDILLSADPLEFMGLLKCQGLSIRELDLRPPRELQMTLVRQVWLMKAWGMLW